MNSLLTPLFRRWLPASWLDNHMFVFSLVVFVLGVALILLAPFSGPSVPLIIFNALTGVVFLVMSIGTLMGWPLRLVIHSSLVFTALNLIYECATSGGLFATAIGWVAVLPMAPMFLLGLTEGLIWFGISNLIYLGLWVAMLQNWIPDELVTNAQIHWYSGISYILSCLTILTLPLVVDRDFKRNMRTSHSREQQLLDKRATLLRAQSFKNSFISTLSHELRTPMNAIMGFNDLLSMRLENNTQALALVNMSRQSGEHLLTVINDLLDFSQMQIGQLKTKPEPFDLIANVRGAFMLFDQRVDSMNIDYQLALAEDLPKNVVSDRHRLTQILVNLLGNAIKFTHQGKVCLSVSRDGAELVFEVRDTGIGVAPERIDKIFERFEQATDQTSKMYGGTGLGLSICLVLVELLGGRMGVESVLGEGSCFWFRLPLIEEAPPRSETTELTVGGSWQNVPVRFLIVDDHPVNRLLACHIVQSHWPQAQLHQAETGKQALAFLASQPCDLVLMDMVMPEMDGIEATALIRQTLAPPVCNVPVVILTANVNQQDHQRCEQAGINGLMVKPFDRVKLCALLEEQLLSSSSFLHSLATRSQA
jgi:signal transduction histidine kinase/CheY-like chemotaxis protein